jgi:sulfur carrier protein
VSAIPKVFIIDMGMEIKLNNQPKFFETQCTLQQLLDEMLPAKQKGIAVAVNKTVIPKVDWHNHSLKQDDDVLIIKATQGG